MKTKTVFAILIFAGIIVGTIIVSDRNANNIGAAPKPALVTKPAVVAEPAALLQSNVATPPVSTPAEQNQPAKSNMTHKPASPSNTVAGGQPLKINGYVVQDPDARVALSSVGSDPYAEAYWSQAINDPTLPSEERKDLIEDLNEDGLSDPQHPTADDMPIIAYRIQMIEQMAPGAMDQVNADAFAEAYKDLVNLYNGRPVD